MKKNIKRKSIFIIIGVVLFSFGAVKLYYELTAGFTVDAITTNLVYNPKWETSLSRRKQIKEEQLEVDDALHQSYRYLARGCQSYVFLSEDGRYVLKFFKYQHFRPKYWITLFDFIPAVKKYEEGKWIEKQKLLDKSFESFEIAFNFLKNETGMIFLQLNKTTDWTRKLTIIDKVGFVHDLDLGQFEFMIQKRAQSFTGTIDEMMKAGSDNDVEQLIDRLLAMLVSEYERGFGDNDHALMQNTGVIDGKPVHIDVGQFFYNPIVKDPKVYKKEIFDKTFFFHQWLNAHYPEIGNYLKERLISLIGSDYFLYPPYQHREGGIGKIESECVSSI